MIEFLPTGGWTIHLQKIDVDFNKSEWENKTVNKTTS